MKKNIAVDLCRPKWSEMFPSKAELIKEALGNNCIALHHIGSTSLPGLKRKTYDRHST